MTATHRTHLFCRTSLAAVVVAVVLGCGDAERTGDAAATDSVGAEVGEHAEDETSGRVTLGEEAARTAGIQTMVVTIDSNPAPVGLEVPGQVEFDPRRVTLITPRTAGRVERLTVVSGDRVAAGQIVALLYSPAYITAQQDLVMAVRRARTLAGSPDAEGAEALVRAARRRMTTLGATDRSVEELLAGGEQESFLAVRAPFAGSIMDADVLTGVSVEAGDSLFRLADLSVVDVIAQVPERALPLVRVGQAATIEIVAYPGMRFDGQVERLREELNPETRTVEAVIHAANRGGRLRPGMYATVRLATDPSASAALRESAARGSQITVPESAVVTDGSERIVFVVVSPGVYERREVDVASLTPAGSAVSATGRVLILRGLTAGDRVVTTGAFTLKSELAKAGLGEHGH